MDTKQHISDLVAILKNKGLAGVVIAPGSRNAPLTQVFYREMPDMCVSLVDERCAGYYALGMAMQEKLPAVIITTSGTAVLNLAPSVAEAFHQHIPLIVITADRPKEWLDQNDNQTINQSAIFGTNCKASYEFPVQMHSTDDLWYANRLVNEAYNKANCGASGPVQINVPLREPLYDDLPSSENVQVIQNHNCNSFQLPEVLRAEWNRATDVMVVCGQKTPDERLETLLNTLSEGVNVTILAESISNIKGETIIENADLGLTQADAPEAPQLVIYYGGQVVSKRLKNYLRSAENTSVWYLSEDGKHVDTFQHLTHVINCSPVRFFEALLKEKLKPKDKQYQQHWLECKKVIHGKINGFIHKAPYSDFWVHAHLSALFSHDDVLFAGNSSVVRYLQFFPLNTECVYSNRGTSGIDGCVSTAAGIASCTSRKVIAVVGDLSFMYDSNGLWNKDLPSNLKVILINNGGGSIFSMIEGPSKQPSYDFFFEANHPVSFKDVAEGFSVEFFNAESKESFLETYTQFYQSPNAALFEIVTSNEANASVFHNFIENIGSDEQ